jgi:hypothetical protein
MQFDQDRASLEPFRGIRPKAAPPPPPIEKLKPEDEHAI